MKRIAILGSTGSIGRQTLDIAQSHPDQLKVVALAAGRRNLPLLAQQINTFKPELVSVPDRQASDELSGLLNLQEGSPRILYGEQGLIEVACHSEVQTVVTAIVGFLGVLPTAAAIRAGKTIALANKETLVAAGSVIIPMCKKHDVKIIPVDSEHSAILQSLSGHSSSDIERILLTASGGPFRTWTPEQIDNATVDDALRHPNWSMGPKITVDSATLMNKGLEIIEARWLFGVSADRITVVVHPQSILHSAVEFVDGSIVGQMGVPDMRLPIHYALFWPHRVASNTAPRLDMLKCKALTFEEPDLQRFPCLALAREVARQENTLPCVLNAANEMAVAAFLRGAIKFSFIPALIEQVLNRHHPVSEPSLDDIIQTDKWARNFTEEIIGAVA